MQTFPPLPAVNLLRRQVIQVRAREGERIECRTGQLWLTQDGDPRDVILAANQSFVVDRSGPVVVSALEDAAFVYRRETPHRAPTLRHVARDTAASLPNGAY